MSQKSKTLKTSKGEICFPAYIPVTTYGDKYPLDRLIKPYLPRLSQAIMVSYQFAKGIQEPPSLPLFLDSGGFISLNESAKIKKSNGLGIIQIQNEDGTKEIIDPKTVITLQERWADVAFTLDFIVPPGMPIREARRRMDLTIRNAIWAIGNRRRPDMKLFACIQPWDVDSARGYYQAYKSFPFDGYAIGGMVPRAQDLKLILSIVEAVKAESGNKPIHVFGIGNPYMVKAIFKAGADSVDSSSYIKMAADGRLWGQPDYKLDNPSPQERMHLAICNLAFATKASMPLSAVDLLFNTTSMMIDKRKAKL